MPIQRVVERYIQLQGCKHVDEIIPYKTEQDLQDILKSFKINVNIVGDEYKDKVFISCDFCEEKAIELYFNTRDDRFSSSDLRKIISEKQVK